MARLLLVEDDPDMAETLAEVFGDRHSVRIASNGEEGLRFLREETPDVIVLDVEMPVLDGPGMAHRMIVEDAGREAIPVVLLSAVTDLFVVACRIGTPYFAPKSTQVDLLLALVDQALFERRAPTPPALAPGR